jgi:hypothetical protein
MNARHFCWQGRLKTDREPTQANHRLNSSNMLRFSALLLLSLIATIVSAIKFDLDAYPSSTAFANRKCLSQYVGVNTMVIVTVKVGEGYNQRVDLEVGAGLYLSLTTSG